MKKLLFLSHSYRDLAGAEGLMRAVWVHDLKAAAVVYAEGFGGEGGAVADNEYVLSGKEAPGAVFRYEGELRKMGEEGEKALYYMGGQPCEEIGDGLIKNSPRRVRYVRRKAAGGREQVNAYAHDAKAVPLRAEGGLSQDTADFFAANVHVVYPFYGGGDIGDGLDGAADGHGGGGGQEGKVGVFKVRAGEDAHVKPGAGRGVEAPAQPAAAV